MTTSKQANDMNEIKQMLAEALKKDCSDSKASKTVEDLVKVTAVQSEQISALAESVKEMSKTIYGNGKEGLTTTVAKLLDKVGGRGRVIDQVVNVLITLTVTAVFYAVLSQTK